LLFLGRVFKVDFLRPTSFLDVKADKKGGGSEGQISPEAIKTDRKGVGGSRGRIYLEAIQANKKVGNFSLSSQEKVPK